ncbi:MAG: hypothetical protein DRP79_06065 [Planctomycetota bacterium]|nr:MAG: hypothetical protein DRP79_06065 [Planctomycetota bacterium]
MARLRVISGANVGKTYPLAMAASKDATSREDSLVIGRDVDNGIIVADQGVSRHHAEIFRIGDRYFLKDMESKNGTFVNDEAVSLEVLSPGDRIRIGQTEFAFEESPADEAAGRVRYSSGAVSAPTMVINLKKIREEQRKLAARGKALAGENFQILHQTAKAISEERNERKLMRSILELASEATGAEEAHVILASPKGELILRESVTSKGQTATVSRTIVNRVIQFHRAVLSQDAAQDERFKKGKSVIAGKVRSVICAPLTVAGKVNGVLYLATSRTSEEFSPENLELITVLAIQLGLALENLRAAERQKALFFRTIRALITALSIREPETLGHSERVANYVKAICDQLDLSIEEKSRMQIAGLLHNIGKLSASDDELRLLNQNAKSARLKQIKRAEKIIKEIGGLDFVLPGIKHVYEQYDGGGIPDGLKGDGIPLMARIIAVADEFDKLTAITGGEGEPMLLKDALEKLRKASGKHLDGDIVTALMIAYKRGTLFETPPKPNPSAQ